MNKRQQKKNHVTAFRKYPFLNGIANKIFYGGEEEPVKTRRVPRRSFKRGIKPQKRQHFIHFIGLGSEL